MLKALLKRVFGVAAEFWRRPSSCCCSSLLASAGVPFLPTEVPKKSLWDGKSAVNEKHDGLSVDRPSNPLLVISG